ncbi:MAG TPA: pitrilysin family protein [Kofleriaceae bacterium]|nr:pitrilysin family protein [Kofleriaceae bacterium]
MKKLIWIAALAACHTVPNPPVQPAPAPTPAPEPTPVADKPVEKPMPAITQTAQPQNLQFPDEDFRRQQPPGTAPHDFKLPPVKPFTLKNGIKVFLVEQHTLPIVSMDLNFDGGSLNDPKGKEGLASACMALLTEGTEKLDKIAYSEALADVASNISSYASDDTQGVQLASLTKHLDTTFALFADTLRTPGLREADFERMKKRRIEAVRQSRTSPTSIPSRVTGPILFGPAHPLGSVITEEAVKAVTIDDCKKYISTWLEPKNARLFVVGDLTEQQVRDQFDKSPLAAWKGTAPKMPAVPKPATMKGKIFFVHVPNAAQSSVMALSFGPTRTAPDYFANSMVAAVFGGSFTSRLNMNLREDKGYSYGARGGFSYSPKAYGTLTVSAPVQADSSYQALLEVDRELKDIATGKRPVNKDELDREKTNAILALPGRFSTAQSALGQYRSLVYYGLPLDYFNTYVEKVKKVTEAEVKTSATKHLKPNEVVYVVVGNGDEKMIVDDPNAPKGALPKDRKKPYEVGGKQLTLREALQQLAAKGDVGKGGFVELDVDGKPIARVK